MLQWGRYQLIAEIVAYYAALLTSEYRFNGAAIS